MNRPPCGTLNGWGVHRSRGESCDQCDPVMEKYLRLRQEGVPVPDDLFALCPPRRSHQGLKPSTVGSAPCGTANGWQGHRRRGELPCRACRGATSLSSRLREAGLPVPPELLGRAAVHGSPPDNFRAVITWLGDEIRIKDLYERDGGVCQLCGRRVLGRPVSPWHPAGPSIDHVVPMARKGLHVWGNVQLAHLLCNSAKNDADEFVETSALARVLDLLISADDVKEPLTPSGAAAPAPAGATEAPDD